MRFAGFETAWKTTLSGQHLQLVRAPYATVNLAFSVTEQRLTVRPGKLKDRDEFNDDEKRLLDLLAQGLSRDFPNPQRIGCPGAPILRGIAFRKLRLSEVSRWLDHLSSCSPCFQEFTEMRKEAVPQRRLTRVWLAVAVALIFAGGGWLWMRTKHSARPLDTAVLDLRGISLTRGESPVQADQRPLEIHRSSKHLIMELPIGSKEGTYDLTLLSGSSRSVKTVFC